MEHATSRNDANPGAQPNASTQDKVEVKPGEEFEGSRPGKKTAAAIVIIICAYVVIDHWAQISAAFS